MSDSKLSKVNDFIGRAAHESIAEMALRYPEQAAFLQKIHRELQGRIEYQATEGYRLRELQDIMDWKRRRHE